MAEPTSRLRDFPNATATTAVDTAAERKGVISGTNVITTGAGNEAEFTPAIDISGGQANSLVKHFLWDITADGGNTTAETFKLWIAAASIGFDQAASVVKLRALSGADQGTPSLTENYIQNAITSSYTFANMPESEPSQNLYPSDEGTSMALSATSDDALMFACYLFIAAAETTGTYKGLDAGYELQVSLKYSYS